MKRRTKIRLISFGAAVFAALFFWGLGASVTARAYKARLNVAEQRALTELTEYLDSIETDLQKTAYAGTGTLLATLSARLCSDAAGAKTCLSALKTGDAPLYNLYKFLSQVGEYTQSLNRKAAAGEPVTEDEQQTLKKLLGYAKSLSGQFRYMNELLNAGCFSFEKLTDELRKTDADSGTMVSFLDAAADAEDSMSDFPTLVYDGPFSDNIYSKSSALLENAEERGLSDARKIAAAALDAKENELVSAGLTEGKLSAYCFTLDKTRIAVTKYGGFVSYILSDAHAGEEKYTGGDAVQRAAAFLNKLGYRDMVSTYFAAADGVCTVNFAYKQGNCVCYPDLIKVSVSLGDGKITALDAADYLMNHIDRTIPSPAVDEETALQTVPAFLDVQKTGLAVIPTDGANERFAYEMLCTDDGGQDLLLYADAGTGDVCSVLLLLYTDGGTLTK